MPELVPSERHRFDESGGQRDQHDQTEIEDGEAQGQTKTRQDAGLFKHDAHLIFCLFLPRDSADSPPLRLLAAGLIDLIEDSFVAEMNGLSLMPVAGDIGQREQLYFWKS